MRLNLLEYMQLQVDVRMATDVGCAVKWATDGVQAESSLNLC